MELPPREEADLDAGRSDQELIAACLGGRPSAFDALARRYEGRLYPLLLRFLGCHEDVRDVVQEAFLQAYRALDRFQSGSGFFTWLYRIAVNRALSLRRKRRITNSLDGADWERSGDVPASSESDQPVRVLERAELRRLVQQALAELPSADRDLLVMRDVEDTGYEAMAQAFRVPVGTIRSRLHRARKKLRDLLQERD